MNVPSEKALARLLRWRPAHGVLSVYLEIDAADRSEGWRVRLRNQLDAAVTGAVEGLPRAAKLALEATTDRVRQRFPVGSAHPAGRTQVGFVEVSESKGREHWYSLQLPLQRVEVLYNHRPMLEPLIAMLDDGAPRGIVLASAERVRLLHWWIGQIEELDSWDLTLLSLDWRDRRAQRPSDPARGQGTTAAGKDQYGQRLEANRDRFLRETGRLAATEARRRGWHELVAFGEERHLQLIFEGLDSNVRQRAFPGQNLISMPAGEIGKRMSVLLDELNRSRELELVERAREEALSGSRGAVGLQETLAALAEGRVEHLLFDAERDYDVEPSLADATGADEIPLKERMIELALSTDASITPVKGEAAAVLAEHEGVVALLRY